MTRMTAWKKLSVFLIILILQTTSTHGHLWSWFALDASTSSQSDPPHQPHCSMQRPTDLAKFDIESGSVLSNSRGKELVEKVRHQTAKHSCWHKAYSGLVSSCREILKEEEKKARLAMRLTNCFLQVSDRAPQQCPDSTPISKCTSGLSDHIHSIFLAFFIDAASMCHHLQSEAFKQETESIVNELKGSAHWVESKLKTMESQTNIILQQSGEVLNEQKLLHTKLQEHSQELIQEYNRLHSEMQEKMKNGLSGLNSATEDVQKQLQGVHAHQVLLADSLSMEFSALNQKTHEISNSLTTEFSEIANSLAKEFTSLHKQSHKIVDSLTTEFSSLHDKTHEIGAGVERSLTGQEVLLASQAQAQAQAMEGLTNLKKLQERALEESRASVLDLTRQAKMHHNEFLAWQSELHSMHEKLAIGSNAMLEAQEAFVSKQAAVFTSLERLFSLHNAILLESKSVKTFLFYVVASVFVYMSTSTKQTYNARALLYCGLTITFAVELWLHRIQVRTSSQGLHQSLLSLIFPRITFGLITVTLLLYNIFTYRDYTALSYEILMDLQERMKGLPYNIPSGMEELCQPSSVLKSKLTRTSTPYGKMLTQKIIRRARLGQSHPITWLIPTWISSLVSEEKEPLPALNEGYSDSQVHVDNESEDPDYKPPLDLNGLDDTTPRHAYNLRPRRSHRASPASMSAIKWESADAFVSAVTNT